LALALSIFGLAGPGSGRRPAPSPAEDFPDDDLPPPGPRCFTWNAYAIALEVFRASRRR
jgi:hypothetical protein